MNRDKLVVVISKDKTKGYELAKSKGYIPARTWVIESKTKANKLAERWNMDILEEKNEVLNKID